MASILKVDSMQGVTSAGDITITGEGTATMRLQQGLAKAWANFDGTGSAASWERDSFNVASYTDNGTSDYTITFSNAMGNANYQTSIGGYKSANMFVNSGNNTSIATSSFRIGEVYSWNGVSSSNAVNSDFSIFGALIHGDLA